MVIVVDRSTGGWVAWWAMRMAVVVVVPVAVGMH